MQSTSLSSVPLHRTLSRSIGPVPCPKKARESAEASVDEKERVLTPNHVNTFADLEQEKRFKHNNQTILPNCLHFVVQLTSQTLLYLCHTSIHGCTYKMITNLLDGLKKLLVCQILAVCDMGRSQRCHLAMFLLFKKSIRLQFSTRSNFILSGVYKAEIILDLEQNLWISKYP